MMMRAPMLSGTYNRQTDDFSEDISIILDRDDSILGGGWTDEEEEEDDGLSEAPLPLAGHGGEDDEQTFCRRISSRSGRWSSFSWSSLYERTTDSSLSWADDELEKETTDKVRWLFGEIDKICFENDQESTDEDEEKKMLLLANLECQDLLSLGLTAETLNECAIWRKQFPHLRIMGQPMPLINLRQHQTTNRTNKHASYPNHDRKLSNPSATSIKSITSDVSTLTLTEEINPSLEQPDIETTDGEILAQHGQYFDDGKTLSLLDNIPLSDKFKENPKKYFEDKIMSAIFRKIWDQLSTSIEDLVDIHADWVLQQQHIKQSVNGSIQCGTIDENTLLNGGGSLLGGGKMLITSPSSSALSPTSVLLPGLRQTPASAPPVRDNQIPQKYGRLQNVRYSTERTRKQLKGLSSAAPIVTTNDGMTSRERSVSVGRRTRSKSGSPHRLYSASSSNNNNATQQQPVSLPPIFGRDSPTSSSGPNSMKFMRANTKSETKISSVPQSKSPIYIAGTKVKKVYHDESGRTSRVSLNMPSHWDVRTFTPSAHMKPSLLD